MMTAAPLVLNSVQQRWLTELHVAAPFVMPFVVKETIKVAEANMTAASIVTTSETTTNNQSPTTAREALQQALGTSIRLRGIQNSDAAEQEQPAQQPAQQHIELAAASVSELSDYANQCRSCELHSTRHQAVVGAGKTHKPEWMVISTAPSSNEELVGLPMQGKSGELFAAQMQSIGIQVEQQLYLTQLIKCRSHSAPELEQLEACFALLKRQIELIQPKRLLLLGSKSCQLFLQNDALEALRGKVHQWQGQAAHLPTVVSYHPASILLRPQLKAVVWKDVLLMKSLMS